MTIPAIAHPLLAVAAKHRLALILSDDLPTEAARLLEHGITSPALEELAALRPTYTDEAQELFREALRELNLEVPNERDAVLLVAREIAAEILAGHISAKAGARQIWDARSRVWSASVPELDTFIYADCEWDEREQDSDLFTQGILEAARDLVGGGSGPRPPAP